MTNKERLLCNGIIHSASAASAVAVVGLSKKPGSDNLILEPIQLSMAIGLGKVFNIELDQISAKSELTNAIASHIGKGFSTVGKKVSSSYTKVIEAVTAAGVTEGAGWIMALEFEKQREQEEKECA